MREEQALLLMYDLPIDPTAAIFKANVDAKQEWGVLKSNANPQYKHSNEQHCPLRARLQPPPVVA